MSLNNLSPADYIVRGILIGGAVGAFGAMLGFSRSMFWGTGIGMIAGFMAGLTLAKRAEKRAAQLKNKQD
ncbi:MAG: hypothetical protein LBV80_05580 [Deltaproteobacteria bacterium]|jgi:gas vesicle protein|nr:hypothetical protein [Deltaproteobacteria bacterium]